MCAAMWPLLKDILVFDTTTDGTVLNILHLYFSVWILITLHYFSFMHVEKNLFNLVEQV